MDLGEGDAHRAEDAGGDALRLVDETEQQVFGADVVVFEGLGFLAGTFEGAFGARGQPHLASGRGLAPADEGFDRGADGGKADAHPFQHASGDAAALADQAEQEVFRADVVVPEPLGFVLSEREDLASTVGEEIEGGRGVAATDANDGPWDTADAADEATRKVHGGPLSSGTRPAAGSESACLDIRCSEPPVSVT